VGSLNGNKEEWEDISEAIPSSNQGETLRVKNEHARKEEDSKMLISYVLKAGEPSVIVE